MSRFPDFQQLKPNRPDHRNNFQNSEASLASFLRQGALTWPSFWLVHCMLIFWLQLGLFSKLKANVDQLHHDFIYLNRSLENRFLFPSCSTCTRRRNGEGTKTGPRDETQGAQAASRCVTIPNKHTSDPPPDVCRASSTSPLYFLLFCFLLKATFYLHKAWKCLLSTQMHRITLRFVCLSIFI